MFPEQIPPIATYVKRNMLRQIRSRSVFLMIILEVKRELDVCSMIFIQRTEKPKDSGGSKAERNRLPVGAVKLKKIYKDTKDAQCSK